MHNTGRTRNSNLQIITVKNIHTHDAGDNHNCLFSKTLLFVCLARTLYPRLPSVPYHGPTPGYCCTSFCAETYSLLSVLQFLQCLSRNTAFPLPSTALHTDSLSCITVIKKMEEWPSYCPNATLCPKWDILQAIVTSKKKVNVIVTTKKKLNVIFLSHVKGHQDCTIPSTISLYLASLSSIQKTTTRPVLPTIPSKYFFTHALHIKGNPVSIYSSHGTITSCFCQSMRRITSKNATVEYIQARNDWTPHPYGFADWETHKKNNNIKASILTQNENS